MTTVSDWLLPLLLTFGAVGCLSVILGVWASREQDEALRAKVRENLRDWKL